jgi:quercetin dioxygenase-like cupin family protein
MGNILTAEENNSTFKRLPNTEWHVAFINSDVLTPRDETTGDFTAFPIIGVTRHHPGGGCIAHSHPAAQCFYIIEGKALFQVGDEERVVEKGSLIFVPPNVLHQYKTLGDEPFTELVMQESLEGLSRHTNYPNLSYPEILSQTLGQGTVDQEKIKQELGWEVVVDERTTL